MDDAALAALLERTALGDLTAFAKLYRRTAPRLYALCVRVLQDRSEAEEALADSYVKIWRYAERYPAAEVPPITWMAAIARNLSIERLRLRKAPGAALTASETLAVTTERVDQRALQRDAGVLAGTLQSLPDEQRRLLRMAYFGGATYAALDGRGGGSGAAIRQALASLREYLGR